MRLRVLNGKEMSHVLEMAELIEGIKLAFKRLSAGQAQMPLRNRVKLPQQNRVLLTMPAALPIEGILAVKMVSVFGKNSDPKLPLIHALVTVFDSETGAPVALMNGEVLTAKRTGAGSGVATDLLANKDAAEVAIIGSGNQARTQLEAVCSVRKIKKVRVYSPNQFHTLKFTSEMSGKGKIPETVLPVESAKAAVSGADIICAATTSSTPVFNFRDLKPGAHVNGIGSFQPTMQEIDSETVKNSLVLVDSRESALLETGDLMVPIQLGLIKSDHIHAELGEMLNGTRPGRTNPEQTTFFKSCGVAVQDAIAAGLALSRAREQKLGQIIEL